MEKLLFRKTNFVDKEESRDENEFAFIFSFFVRFEKLEEL